MTKIELESRIEIIRQEFLQATPSTGKWDAVGDKELEWYRIETRTKLALRKLMKDIGNDDLYNKTISFAKTSLKAFDKLALEVFKEELDGRLRHWRKDNTPNVSRWSKVFTMDDRKWSAFYDDGGNAYPSAEFDLYNVFDRTGEGVMAVITVLPDGDLRISLEDDSLYLDGIGADPDVWLKEAFLYALGCDVFVSTDDDAPSDLVLVPRGDEHFYTKG